MGLNKHGGGLLAASLFAWILMMPPLSVSPAGKTVVDTGAPLSRWESFSRHSSAGDCRKHRDHLRQQVEQAAASTVQEPVKKGSDKEADKAPTPPFATLRQRAAAARCVSSSDSRLARPAARPAEM
jgi:hypothetical protein